MVGISPRPHVLNGWQMLLAMDEGWEKALAAANSVLAKGVVE